MEIMSFPSFQPWLSDWHTAGACACWRSEWMKTFGAELTGWCWLNSEVGACGFLSASLLLLPRLCSLLWCAPLSQLAPTWCLLFLCHTLLLFIRRYDLNQHSIAFRETTGPPLLDFRTNQFLMKAFQVSRHGGCFIKTVMVEGKQPGSCRVILTCHGPIQR